MFEQLAGRLAQIRPPPRLTEPISAVSTSDNEILRRSRAENVFLHNREPGPDGWLPARPSSVALLLRRRWPRTDPTARALSNQPLQPPSGAGTGVESRNRERRSRLSGSARSAQQILVAGAIFCA